MRGGDAQGHRNTDTDIPIRDGKRVRLVCVGDVHGCWSEESTKALESLEPDVALFVGDMGNEDVELVESIAQIQLPKAVILGNHDAWNSLGRRRDAYPKVSRQLEALGDDHVGFSTKSFPNFELSIVGARPFSKGGGDWNSVSPFYAKLYGMGGFQDATNTIVASALHEPQQHSLIFLAHNGPTGLGEEADSICGVDWLPGGGDHGDIDLENAIADVTKERRVPVVIFGHMHEKLKKFAKPPRTRRMFHYDSQSGVAYVNCAVVPRIKHWKNGSVHHFVIVEMQDGKVAQVQGVWVGNVGEHEFKVRQSTTWFQGVENQSPQNAADS
eukprot:CAMPEP_0198247008 /NCGR_PEP_ID=MMETSP1446-20131203/46262_1 /TAXON_ID=1461542 ORGANISM="Unidentified sp, Strain CCMP2111" /NCGR_SAMPLE_ID=MMETSP1446 /ASSEMBLY_ACC=CAM_ASM_001112 /LENGTH=326 /DNA_ID=CAMNT_0043931333 /DNA_START=1457 /DNA_END=2437 /DNA_ORIENTATION=-